MIPHVSWVPVDVSCFHWHAMRLLDANESLNNLKVEFYGSANFELNTVTKTNVRTCKSAEMNIRVLRCTIFIPNCARVVTDNQVRVRIVSSSNQ
jgi:hypothetical protein